MNQKVAINTQFPANLLLGMAFLYKSNKGGIFKVKNNKMVLWLALIVMAVIPVYAQQYNDEKDFQVVIVDGRKGIEITKYIGSKKEVSIPPSIQNKPVTVIGKEAFQFNRNITKVIIPDSVISIEDRAFDNCTSLTGITIPNSVTSIGVRTFGNCINLTSVNIPNSIKNIGIHAFNGCISLSSVTIGNNVTSIGNNAFSGCTSLKSSSLFTKIISA